MDYTSNIVIRKIFLMALLFLTIAPSMAQTGIVRGRVINKINNEPLPFASIILQGTQTGTVADELGRYELAGISPGLYNVKASFLGFEEQTRFEIQVTNARPAIVDFELTERPGNLADVEIRASPFAKPDESPVSLRQLGTDEIKRMPGGNRDISRVVRALPGVASTPSFRNDIIIRGGAPNENKFYLDGIEVPVINHFQTQGSSGGPVGMINVDLIREVDFYSGAFPANRGNALSSVFEFKQKDGRDDKITLNGIVGASDLGLTLEGPLTSKSTFIVSARRSYLQYLFSVIGLPFLPTYNDFQFKYKYKINQNNQITLLGLGAIDNFRLNFEVEDSEENQYLLNILPVNEQWNYTVGMKYERFRKNGVSTLVLSRNKLNNTAVKYRNNDDSNPENLIQDYLSNETETKFRLEDFSTKGNWRITYGLAYEHARYFVDDYNQIVTQEGLLLRNFTSTLGLNKWGAFAQASTGLLQNKLTLSLGLRTDANDYSPKMNNILAQLSPRISASYALAEDWSLNFNTGIYYQLPPYTVLGYRNGATNELENKTNGVTYIRNKQWVGGIERTLEKNTRITLEGFYKKYDQYPFLVEENISLANLGADFGVIGNAPVTSTSEGRAYGLEVLAQQKLFKGFYGLLAYTFVRSEFQNAQGEYVPSTWDNRHIVSMTAGKRFGRNWELGSRFLFSGGAPFTPFNVPETMRRQNWDVRSFGLPDYTLLNTQRGGSFHQLDLRLDKKYFFNKWSLNLFFDIQNAYNFKSKGPDFIDVVRDTNGQPVVNPEDSDFYLPKFISNTNGTILPTLGIIIEL